MDLKRQLLLQEVTNLLLQVDITRRETELTHYKESKQRSLNRSSTYSDLDPDEKVAFCLIQDYSQCNSELVLSKISQNRNGKKHLAEG